MLNKPSILTLLLIAISFGLAIVVGIIFAILGMKSNSGANAAVVLGAALYVGQIYAKKFQIELPKAHKIKITLYYFLIQMALSIGIVALLQNSKLAGPLVAVSIFLNVFISLFIYPALGRGCRMKLKQLETKGLLNNQPELQS